MILAGKGVPHALRGRTVHRLGAVSQPAGQTSPPTVCGILLPTTCSRPGCRVTSIQKLLGHTNLNTPMTYARAFDQTVMLDYFRALDALESQPDGAWFRLDEIPLSGP